MIKFFTLFILVSSFGFFSNAATVCESEAREIAFANYKQRTGVLPFWGYYDGEYEYSAWSYYDKECGPYCLGFKYNLFTDPYDMSKGYYVITPTMSYDYDPEDPANERATCTLVSTKCSKSFYKEIPCDQ